MILLTLPLAVAEGTAELGSTQQIDPLTQIKVDILDHTTETFTWEGGADIEVRSPSNVAFGTYAPGSTIDPDEDGAWTITLSDYEDDWDISVDGAAPGMGRVWSRAWRIDASTFGEDDGLDGSFYAVVDGGGTGYDAVVEMSTEGFAGYIYILLANSDGIAGANGRSVPETSGSLSYEYPLYLNPPEDATYTTLTPEVTTETWSAGTCDSVVYELVDGEFTFTSATEGTYHIVCDINGDGVFDITSDDDLSLLGDATTGVNTITWDGADNAGDPVDPGTYTCEIRVTVGEFHYVADDVETSYPGFRLFLLDPALARTGLDMYWNDAEVQANEDDRMPNGVWSLESSGADGVNSGTYGSATVANTNARSWGNFEELSKGNEAYLDTYTWAAEDTSDTFEVIVADWTLDTDRDGLIDAQEECSTGTDPTLADTDGDGLGDYEEAIDLPTDAVDADSDDDGVVDGDECGTDCGDTDGDGLIDPVDSDDDGDGIATLDEDVDGDGDPTNDDADGDGVANYLDTDDDGDGVATADEDTGADGDVAGDDWDEDGTPNWLDTDDDGDGALTAEEDHDADGDPRTDDTDGDGTADWLDVDDDGDGLASVDEDTSGDGSPVGDDDDGDGLDNYLDPDSDGDGIEDGVEGAEDTDGDGAADFVDIDADGDGLLDADEGVIDSDGDGAEDFQDADDDGDGIGTIEEGTVDTDGDGADDHLDSDDDDDGIPTLTEGGFDIDTDGDGTSDHHDLDSDDDGILDATEEEDDVDGDGIGNWRDLDSDADSLSDTSEGETDSDADGAGDWVDADDDDDTVPTIDEVGVDTDGDGADDHLDPDDDDDGIPTANENDPRWADDVDADGIPNWRDTDADDDGLLDADEGEDDVDDDAVPNYLDPDGEYTTWYQGGCEGCSSGGSVAGSVAWLGVLGVFLRRRR